MRAAILALTVLFQTSTLLADSGDQLRLDLQSVDLREDPDRGFELGLNQSPSTTPIRYRQNSNQDHCSYLQSKSPLHL